MLITNYLKKTTKSVYRSIGQHLRRSGNYEQTHSVLFIFNNTPTNLISVTDPVYDIEKG